MAKARRKDRPRSRTLSDEELESLGVKDEVCDLAPHLPAIKEMLDYACATGPDHKHSAAWAEARRAFLQNCWGGAA